MHIKEYSVPGVCIRHQQALCWFYGAPCKTRLVPYIIIHNRYIAITCLNQVGKEYQRQKKPRVEVTRTDNIAWTVAYSVCSFFSLSNCQEIYNVCNLHMGYLVLCPYSETSNPLPQEQGVYTMLFPLICENPEKCYKTILICLCQKWTLYPLIHSFQS